MQRLEVSGAVRPIYGSLGVKRLRSDRHIEHVTWRPKYSVFYCCRRNEFAKKHCCSTLNIFMLLTVICSSTIRRQNALLCFINKNGYSNAPQYCVLRTLSILFNLQAGRCTSKLFILYILVFPVVIIWKKKTNSKCVAFFFFQSKFSGPKLIISGFGRQQWRTQEFCSGGDFNHFSWGQRTENGDLGAVAP